MSKKLLWVVQNNLYNEYGYVAFIQALDRYGSDYIIVKPVPFTNIILPADFDSAVDEVDDAEDPIVDEDRPIIVCGATSLTRIAKARKWSPGSFLNDNFHYEKWKEGFGAVNMLNAEGTVGTVAEIQPPQYEEYFVRPTEDSKAISGTVMSKYDFEDWLQQISLIEEEEFVPLHRNTEIVVSPVQQIYAEYRMFVVDGKVVTGSLYKRGNMVISDANVDQDIYDFTYQMVQQWWPAEAFVIDVARTPVGLKIIEVNNINSAGFYAADPYEIIDAIEHLIKYGSRRSPGILI